MTDILGKHGSLGKNGNKVPVVPTLELYQIRNVTNVVARKVDNQDINLDEFFIISVWFPNVANKFRPANCSPDSYHTFIKTTHLDKLLNHCRMIWEKGLVPIEAVQINGAVFYALPKQVIKEKTIRNYSILRAEEEIPSVEDFLPQ